jgi:hypothetical protein
LVSLLNLWQQEQLGRHSHSAAAAAAAVAAGGVFTQRLGAPFCPAGGASLLAGATKLYASHSGLQSLEGLQALTAIRYLYLDHNALPAEELLRLPGW